jgi:polyisoprenoid-binding protein YceI
VTSNENPVEWRDFVGKWMLDPDRTSIVFHTKAMWVFPAKGTARAIEGVGTMGTDGGLSGSLVVDAASIDTKNRKRDAHLRTADFFEVETFPTINFEATSGDWQARASSSWPEPSLSTVRQGRSPYSPTSALPPTR